MMLMVSWIGTDFVGKGRGRHPIVVSQEECMYYRTVGTGSGPLTPEEESQRQVQLLAQQEWWTAVISARERLVPEQVGGYSQSVVPTLVPICKGTQRPRNLEEQISHHLELLLHNEYSCSQRMRMCVDGRVQLCLVS